MEDILQGGLGAGAPIDPFSNREFVKTPIPSSPTSDSSTGTLFGSSSSTPTTDSRTGKEEASRVELDLAALHIHGEEDGSTGKSDFQSQEQIEVLLNDCNGIGILEMLVEDLEKCRKAKKKMVLLTKKETDVLIARSQEPPYPLPRFHPRLLDTLSSDEEQEKMRGFMTDFIEASKALRAYEDGLVEQYNTNGCVYVEVFDEDDETFPGYL